MRSGDDSTLHLPPQASRADDATAADSVRDQLPPPAASARPFPSEGDEVQGRFRYRITKRLGSGGFGTVFLAECLGPVEGTNPSEAPPSEVAIKVIKGVLSPVSKGLLARELAALRRVRHPHVPRLYDWSMEPPVAFFVMPHYRRGSLQDLRKYIGPMDEPLAWRLLSDLLSAVIAAHAAGVLHLDIKPGNVLVDNYDGFVLTDFGISLSMMGPTGFAPGTPGYQSPEQRMTREAELQARTDLWGVGATVWSMCTGIELSCNVPLRRDSDARSRIGFPSVREQRPEISEALDSVLMRLLACDQDDRPGGAAEALALVKAALANGAIDDVDAFRAAQGAMIDGEELQSVLERLLDPLWTRLVASEGFGTTVVRFDDGAYLARQGEDAYYTYVLLHGEVVIEFNGAEIDVVDREGAFLGEVSTLTGRPRTASMRARGPVYASVFNAAELDRFVFAHPGVGVRLIRELAERLARDRESRS